MTPLRTIVFALAALLFVGPVSAFGARVARS